MKKLDKRSLVLTTETVRSLDRKQLVEVAGGGTSLSKVLQSCDKNCCKLIDE